MAITSGYFNSTSGDRKYNAETMSKYFTGLISKGVLQNYADKFIVTASEGMTVQIGTGKAYFSDGKWAENISVESVTLDASDVVLNRIDRIVLRRDISQDVRDCTIILRKGTPATEPVAPDLVSTSYIEELSLATVYVGKLVEAISQSDITDTRLDSSVCGFVTGLIEQVDTSDLHAQYETAFNEYYTQQSNEFETWFSTLKEELSTSTLVREFSSRYVTTVADETEIPIDIPQYNSDLDVLDVYINGLRLVPNVEYTATNTVVTLALPLGINQPVELVVFKSVDGKDAVTVIEQVEELQSTKANNNSTTITLLASDWVDGAQTITVDGVTANSTLLVSAHPDSYSDYAGVYASSQALNSVTFTATDIPDVDLKVNVLNFG